MFEFPLFDSTYRKFLEVPTVKVILATKEELKKNCHVCCKHVDTGECKSTGELTTYFGRVSNITGIKENRTIFRQPGSPCNNFEGLF